MVAVLLFIKRSHINCFHSHFVCMTCVNSFLLSFRTACADIISKHLESREAVVHSERCHTPDSNLTLGAQGRPFGKLTLSVGGLRGGGGGGGWMMTSRSKGSTSPSMPLSVSSGSSSSSRASSFLKGSRSLYVSRLSCLTKGWPERGERWSYVKSHLYIKSCFKTIQYAT